MGKVEQQRAAEAEAVGRMRGEVRNERVIPEAALDFKVVLEGANFRSSGRWVGIHSWKGMVSDFSA